MRRVVLGTLPIAFVLAACGSSSSTTTDSGPGGGGMDAAGPSSDTGTAGGNKDAGGGGGTDTGGQVVPDGGTGTQPDASMAGQPDGGGGGMDGATATSGSGNVTITQQTVMVGMMAFNSYSISASFTPPGAGNCSSSQVGACLVVSCPAGAPPPLFVSAGNITVSGGQLAAPAMIMPGTMNQYAPSSGQMRAFNAGDMFHIVAAGAAEGVPAFDGMVTGPSDLMLTQPVFMMQHALVINRAQDLSVVWTTGAAPVGQVEVQLVGPTGGMNMTVVEVCRFNIADGMNSVPAATLSMIPAGSGAISIRSDNTTTVMAGGFNVNLSAGTGAATANGALAASQATFQ